MPVYFKRRTGIVQVDINDPAFLEKTWNGWSVWMERELGAPREELRFNKRNKTWVTPCEYATLRNPHPLGAPVSQRRHQFAVV